MGQNGKNPTYLAEMRREGVPLEYIVGRAAFMELLPHCSPDTLIPREETELLVQVALDSARQMEEGKDELTDRGHRHRLWEYRRRAGGEPGKGHDPCHGSKSRCGRGRPEERERVWTRGPGSTLLWRSFRPFRWLGLENAVDIVVCNPPYLPTSTVEKLAPEIIDHEPVLALDAGAYGLAIFRRLIADALTYLRPQGVLVFEIGAGQDKLVTRILSRNQAMGISAISMTGSRCVS